MTLLHDATTQQTALPHSTANVIRASRTVIVYTIADVFDLTEDEAMWAVYHLDAALKPFAPKKARALASPVRHELESGFYSDCFAKRDSANPQVADPTVASADAIDWATALSNVVLESFPHRPMESSVLIGSISGILTELGVGHATHPRASKYLPNAVRYLRNQQG